jgi:hypothetical protein
MNTTTPTWTLVNSYNFRQPERVYFNPYNQYEMWVTSFGNGMKVTTLPNSIENINAGNATTLEVYPNPAEDMVNINTRVNANAGQQIQVYDAGGRLIQQLQPSQLGTTGISVKDWVPGVYFINYGAAHAKFVKQ